MSYRQQSSQPSRAARPPSVELVGIVMQIFHSKRDPMTNKTFYIFKFQPDPSGADNFNEEANVAPKDDRGRATQYHIKVKLDTPLVISQKMRIALRGFFQKDGKFGWQFKATTAEADTAKSKQEAVLTALGGVKGNNGCPLIGKERLKKIKSTLGSDIGAILTNQPERLREAVPALTDEDIQRLADAWRNSTGDDAQILAKLQEFEGIGEILARAVLDEFGKNALTTIRRDPYLLAKRVPGIGFQTADKIALSLNLPPQARCLAQMNHAVREAAAENGDCGKSKAEVVRAGMEISGLEQRLVEEILNGSLGQKNSDIVEENGILWLKALMQAEEKIANWIRESLQKAVDASSPANSGRDERPRSSAARQSTNAINDGVSSLPQPSRGADTRGRVSLPTVSGLSPEQHAALAAILVAPVSILTGGPGTGKTTLLKAVVQSTTDCVLCAPTGRAAKRLAEITGHEAMTLHRLVLRKDNPLTANTLLIIDESSMADVAIMAELAQRCAKRLPRLLFVGDADQLPSVGAGQVFRDLIESGKIPVHRLTKNFRTVGEGGGIIQAAAAVLQGKVPKPVPFDSSRDFCLIETETAEEAAEKAVEFATQILPQQCSLDPLQDVQVLTPMRGGAAGTQSLNASLRQHLNPVAPAATDEIPFAAGDRVINLQNQPALGIYNGDLGVVVKVNHSKKDVTVRFDGKEILLDAKRLRWLALAYAVTTHKSQGSEYPAVVVVLTKGHFVLLDRNLLYTAMTRAQRHLVLIAQKGALYLAIKDNPRPRLTRLKQRICSESDS